MKSKEFKNYKFPFNTLFIYRSQLVLSEYLQKNSSRSKIENDLLDNYNHILMKTIQQELNLDVNQDLIEILQKDFSLDKSALEKYFRKESPEENAPHLVQKGEINDINMSSIESTKPSTQILRSRGFSPKNNCDSYRPKNWNKGKFHNEESKMQPRSRFSHLSRLSPLYVNKENFRIDNRPNYESRFNNKNSFYQPDRVNYGFSYGYSKRYSEENPERSLYSPANASAYSKGKPFY
jgi:hypothetical protein